MDISIKDILETQDIAAIKERFDYTVRLGAIATVTGEVGSGKSTALRYVISKLHPSEYKTVWITACSGSILEFYRLFLAEFGIHMAGSQKAIMIRLIKKAVREVILEKKMKIVLILDEASLMRLEVFAEIPHHLGLRARLKTLAPHHPDGEDKSHRQADVSNIPASCVKNRRKEPHGTGKQARNGTVPLSPSISYRSQIEPLRRCRCHCHPSRVRRDIQKGKPSRKRRSHRSGKQPILNHHGRSRQAGRYRDLLINKHRAGTPGSVQTI